MEAAELAATAAGGRGDPTGFVLHQMAAHPELGQRLKDFIVNPPPCMHLFILFPPLRLLPPPSLLFHH